MYFISRVYDKLYLTTKFMSNGHKIVDQRSLVLRFLENQSCGPQSNLVKFWTSLYLMTWMLEWKVHKSLGVLGNTFNIFHCRELSTSYLGNIVAILLFKLIWLITINIDITVWFYRGRDLLPLGWWILEIKSIFRYLTENGT